MPFAGTVAFVTGAAGGIGAETARILAGQGSLVAVLDRDAAGASVVAESIHRAGGEAMSFGLDVTDTTEVERAVAEVRRARGHIDLLVNAAGVYGTGLAETLDDDAIARVMDVNFGGVVRTCRAVLPGMIEAPQRRDREHVVITRAQRSDRFRPLPPRPRPRYWAGPRSLAREKGDAGIRVNAVAPGPIDTRFWRGSMNEETYQAAKASRVTSIPLGRLGTAEDVAQTIVFLLGPGAAFITGQVVSIGGGEIM